MRTLQLFTLALLATAARADIITFHDLTSGRTVDGSSRSAECNLQFSTVSNGECKIAAPAGMTLNHDFDDTLFILDDPLPAGPDTRISDRFRLVGFGGDTFYTIFFNSFDGTTTCLLWENCSLGYKVTETRSPEFIGAFFPIDFSAPNSNDQASDVIRFESDTDPVPEPPTLLLLATVTLALLTSRRLRCGAPQ